MDLCVAGPASDFFANRDKYVLSTIKNIFAYVGYDKDPSLFVCRMKHMAMRFNNSKRCLFYNILSRLPFPIILQYFKKSDIDSYNILCSGTLCDDTYALKNVMSVIRDTRLKGVGDTYMADIMKFIIRHSQNINIELKDFDVGVHDTRVLYMIIDPVVVDYGQILEASQKYVNLEKEWASMFMLQYYTIECSKNLSNCDNKLLKSIAYNMSTVMEDCELEYLLRVALTAFRVESAYDYKDTNIYDLYDLIYVNFPGMYNRYRYWRSANMEIDIIERIDESIVYNCTYGAAIYGLPANFYDDELYEKIHEIKQKEFKKIPGVKLVDIELVTV